MARQVSYPNTAALKAFQDVSHIEDSFDWQDYAQDICGLARELWQSFYTCDKWLGREDHALLENNFAYFGISEYCGLACVWIALKDNDYTNQALQTGWINSIRDKFHKNFGDLVRIGVFSNGEALYEKKVKSDVA